jgi:glycerol uptake operon antiterminator
MTQHQQKIFPAAKNMKDLEKMIETSYEYVVMLGIHISQLQALVSMVKDRGKKLLLHADLINGLNSDDHAAEYLSQVIKPFGLISTRSNVILKAKQNNLLAIQRLFLLDTSALEKGYSLVQRTKPDFIEVLPGVMPHIIKEVHERTGIPVIAGGLIRTVEEVDNALSSGAVAVTTSKKELWEYYK